MLALIAGEGRLPGILAATLDEPPLVVAVDGHPPRDLEPEITFRLERLGSLIKTLKKRGVSEVCFAGAIQRPRVDASLIDMATLPLVPRMMKALQEGDDAALRALLDTFEEKGLAVRGAHEIAPSLLPPEGVLSAAQPDAKITADTERAVAVADALGRADVGQGVIVSRGQVVAMESVSGTDWMLRSVGQARQEDAGALAFPKGVPRGGVFYKAAKPGQDRRVDLPVIGPHTIDAALVAGLRAVVVKAGDVMMLDRDDTIARADAAQLVLWVRP